MRFTRRDFLRSVGATVGILAGGRAERGQSAPSVAATSDADLAAFRNPPTDARPFVRWWWNGNKVRAEELLRELDLLRAAGIGGVEINSIRFPAPQDPLNVPAVEWLGPEWCELVRVAVEGARARGLTPDIIVGSGWPFGGRFLPRKYQTQILSVGRRRVEGPTMLELSREELLAEVELKLHSKHDDIEKSVLMVHLTPAAVDQFVAPVEVTDRYRDDRLRLEIPPGPHVVHWFVVQTGFQAVINGAPGSDGPVLNHFNREAVEFYLNHMSEGLRPYAGKLGRWFRAVFCDSLELEGANWNPDLFDEFARRRGYDLRLWLAYLLPRTGHMGETVEDASAVQLRGEMEDLVARVRYDYWITLIELFRERFIEPFVEWCRREEVKSRVQAYGHGYEPLDSSTLVDIPECETWLNRQIGTDEWTGPGQVNNKFTSSGARLAGRRRVSCEEITNTQYVFFTPLSLVKIAGDESYLTGVTHPVLHGFNYSPPEAGVPGWVRYGTYFSEHNTWWPFLRRWTDYKARLTWLFEQAEPQASVAIVHPLADLWSRWGMQRDPFPRVWHPKYSHLLWRALHALGHNCDYANETGLVRAEMRDGAAHIGPRRYETIILMEVDTLRPDAAAALERFCAAGGRLVMIGRPPSRAPGLKGRGEGDRTVRETMERLRANHPARCHVVEPPREGGDLVEWFRGVQLRCGLEPDVRIEPAHWTLRQTHHRWDRREVFFFANTHRERVARFRAEFRTVGERLPWLWNPETGDRRPHPWTEKPNILELELDPGESRLIVFEPGPAPNVPPEPQPDESRAWLPSPALWRVELRHVNGERHKVELTHLANIGTLPGQTGFAGTAVYDCAFEVPPDGAFEFLDLGTVHEISEVILDGRPLGVRWYGRHRYPLPAPLAPGRHHIEIRVTTVLGNWMQSLKDNWTAQRWTAKLPARPMGLLGPVRLYPRRPLRA
ncbi:MAG: glycosyl hydrolase [Kiritimatiellae bacterium]|nr:glycosyl hydrolase [Kiritimatiellia bacterium]